MTITVYIASAALVFVFSGLRAMAGIGAAFLFVPLAMGVKRAAAGLNALAQTEKVVRKLAALVFIGAGAYSLWRFVEAAWGAMAAV